MKYAEREQLVAELPYESRLGFIAYCIDRCFKEARRHVRASQQLEHAPLLAEGLDMLWARAERGQRPDPARIAAILDHVDTYERPAPDMESVLYNRDIILVQAARMMRKGMRALQNPDEATPSYVAGALEGPAQSVNQIYADWKPSGKAELGVIDTALERLRAWGSQPFSRNVFDGIPEWTRGDISRKYASDQIRGSALADDE